MDYENTPASDSAAADLGREPDALTDNGQLVAELAALAAAAARSGGVPLVAGPDGVVVLPQGATLDDIQVRGRDLVIELPDGRVIVIADGAVFVPEIAIDGVAVPPLNLAALLIGEERIEPAAGPNAGARSSGGNFFEAAGPIQDAFDLGDLLPPTALFFNLQTNDEDLFELVDTDDLPSAVIVTVDQPAGATSATATVAESGLPARGAEPAGSNAAAATETTTGSIVITSLDGIGSITINGTLFTGVGQTFVSPRGTLTITSFNPATGTLGFSYTLTDNLVGASLADQFTVTVTDPDGDVATATLTVSASDDAPTARADTDAVPASTFTAQTGNVVTGVGTTSGAAGVDTLGADGATVTRVASVNVAANTDTSFDASGNLQVTGQYGVLTIRADGSYAYTRSAGTPGGVSDVFNYTLTDADGSASSANLTIAIGDAAPVITSLPPAGSPATIVNEAGLPVRPGEAPGSQAPAPINSTSGTISFTGGDGPATVTINGTAVAVGATITVPNGVLTITAFDPNAGTIGYTFTLNDNTSGDASSVTFAIVVTDRDGDTAPGNFTITIVDDAPTARPDAATQASENAAVTVNVFANDTPGADSVALNAIAAVPGTLSGAGSLAYNGNGSFTYTPAPGEQGTVTFDYTITDGDGDSSRATVTITLLADSTPTIAVAGDNDVLESNLGARPGEPAGSQAAGNGETAAGTIALTTGGDTVASLVVNGVNVTNGGTVTTTKGALTVSLAGGGYSYSYTLTDNTLAATDSDTFTLSVTDSDGDVATTSLVVAIVDDAPSAANDGNSIPAGAYGPVGGNVIANDTQGADGASVISYAGAGGTGAAGTSVAGQYGTLTIAANGTYSYTRNAGTAGGVSDSFTYTIQDGDNDTATANLVIAIADSPTTLTLPISGTPGSTQVLEAGLGTATITGSAAAGNGEFATGSFSFTAPDGPASVTIGGVAVSAVGQTFAGAFGTLTITSIAAGQIGYGYQLTTNTGGDATSDAFAVRVTDKDGDFTAGNLTIAIVDDVPTARNDGPFSPPEDTAIRIDALANDTRGADGVSLTAAVAVTTGPTKGTVVYNGDGSFTYTPTPGKEGADSFTYTITDGDGDPSTATVTLN
ncbi:MAG TPA: tandem-95 repeat protein, partial [Novosphingobium sp.]|nr:tandem-95 repeat protein [Novosphingobium sp.]